MTEDKRGRQGWIGGALGMLAGIALGAGGALFGQSGAQAQISATAPIEIASSSIGNYSHAWAVDPVTRQIIHCKADNGSVRECKALPMPTAGRI